MPIAETAETIIQAVSAAATAAAAVFAALSARSAAASAREMQHARELSSAPVLTMAPTKPEVGYHLDLVNGGDGAYPYSEHLLLENHGNGPALNLSIHFELVASEPDLTEEVLVGESTWVNTTRCFASKEGLRWEKGYEPGLKAASSEGTGFITSLAKAEGERLSIPQEVMRRWLLDAVSYNASQRTGRQHVTRLIVSITYDTILRRSQRVRFQFSLRSKDMPALGYTETGLGGGLHYSSFVTPEVADLRHSPP